MRTLVAGLTSHLAGRTLRLVRGWKVTRQDGQVFGFTSHDRDVVFDGLTYAASSGINPTATEAQTKLAPDNMEAAGILDSEAITAEDLAAGIWDYAAVVVYLFDWADADNAYEVIHAGRIGEVRTGRGAFTAELRGLADAYSQVIGQIYQPNCRAQFCDARCGLDAADYTVTGTLDSVSANGLVLADAARTEPGPAGGLAISGITKATAPVMSITAHGLVVGQVFYVAGVAGMTEVNGLTLQVKTVTNANTIVVYGVDTTDFGTYTSGGTATPQGDVGHFDGGLLTITSGPNANISREVKAYSPGVITLQLPFPFALTGTETYSLLAGCGKRFAEDCVDRYENGVNFRGEPHVPGMNRIQWVGADQ
jgi:hypothetical protein